MYKQKILMAIGLVGISITTLAGCGQQQTSPPPTNQTSTTSSNSSNSTNNNSSSNNATNETSNTSNSGDLSSNNATNETSNTPTSGNPSTNNSTATNTTTSNQSGSSADESQSNGFIHFNLTDSQMSTIKTSLANIGVQNPNSMQFYGADVWVPAQLPQGTQLESVQSGGQQGYPMFISLVFNTFTMTELNHEPLYSDMQKISSPQLNGNVTGTWYKKGSTYYLLYKLGNTYISLQSDLKTITQSQLQTVASTYVNLSTFH